jgi:hypothetical protein
MQKKYQVFISSTFRDLVDERQDILKSVLDMGHIPSGMEIFPAADVEQFEYIKKIIDECDYYVLVVGARYGSVDEAGVSYTEKEYRYAVAQKKTVLAFIHNDVGSIPASKTDVDQALQAKLSLFRKEVAKSRVVQFWAGREDLKAKVIISLHKAMAEYPAIGWMRADVAASEDLLAQINQLRQENDTLRSRAAPEFEGKEQLADIQSSFVVRYSYSDWSARQSTYITLYDAVKIDWKTLFVLVAPQFTEPRSGGINFNALTEVLMENRFIPPARQSVELFKSDISTVESQLHAYDFISSDVSGTVGGGVSRFTELTPLGRRRQLEWATVKSELVERIEPKA